MSRTAHNLIERNSIIVQIEKNRGEKGGFGPLTSMGSGRIENSFSDMSISSSGTGFGSVSGFGLTTTDVDSFSSKPKGWFS
jgi:coatomer subunit delta